MGYGNKSELNFDEEPQLELEIEQEPEPEAEVLSEEFSRMLSRMFASLTDLINERFDRIERLLQKSTDAIQATLDNIDRRKEAKRYYDQTANVPALKPARKRRRNRRWRQKIIQ